MIWLVTLLSCAGLIWAEQPLNHNEQNDRVIGGYDADRLMWRWQASLQYDSYNDGYFGHICGGTIIDAFYIMTAAHCILSKDSSKYRVVVGEYQLYKDEGTEQNINVESIIVHPEWNGDLGKGNDIALLKLADPVIGTNYVLLANLPYPEQTLDHDFTCYISGWGLIDYVGTPVEILQEAPISVVEHAVCSRHEVWGSLALKTMVCAGGDGVISGCQGDSGGPLNCYTDGAWRVHGVVSYGPAGMCNQYSKPTVFTRVSSFMDWMYSITGSRKV
ncbi:chymotrypsin-like elastase family member 1 [Cololabis saira]|uniref:chymotrypsin-like elastase family member 1 n=1 Tax=Cololabis saira TaxID=129043 RepID=UPI002AD2986A|nr:chymotrypsin-like elastase family member 1 [Cololabis saira]